MTNLRKLAQGKPCMIRTPVCSYNEEQTVLCHLRYSSTGMSHKENDLIGAWGCFECHRVVDDEGPHRKLWTKEERDMMHMVGVIRTQQELIRLGVIK